MNFTTMPSSAQGTLEFEVRAAQPRILRRPRLLCRSPVAVTSPREEAHAVPVGVLRCCIQVTLGISAPSWIVPSILLGRDLVPCKTNNPQTHFRMLLRVP